MFSTLIMRKLIFLISQKGEAESPHLIFVINKLLTISIFTYKLIQYIKEF